MIAVEDSDIVFLTPYNEGRKRALREFCHDACLLLIPLVSVIGIILIISFLL